MRNYTRTAKLYLKAWRKKPINEITRQMVLKKHQEISAENGKVTANNVMRHLRSVWVDLDCKDYPVARRNSAIQSLVCSATTSCARQAYRNRLHSGSQAAVIRRSGA
ncbi:hypothetical protein HED50_18635 [Ochrobactrum oryzae]|nr:hypothetical protein [Brucella oryzae]